MVFESLIRQRDQITKGQKGFLKIARLLKALHWLKVE